MPTYDYKCDGCNHQFEIVQSLKDTPLTKCPKCKKSKLKKIFTKAPGIKFNGPGWTPKFHR